jgi:acetyltransferase-like isoleucine patch superfamily enzyme
MSRFINKALHALAVRDRRFEDLYQHVIRPNGYDWAEMLRERGDFYGMGDHCYIDPHALIEDRAYIRLGHNVRIATCTILGHDGAVNMINRALGLRLDSVGKIDIRDNVYIGIHSIILPGVTIGPNAIVSAGSVVRSDVAEGDVVAGVPAKRLGRFEITVEMLKAKNRSYPWRHLMEQRSNEREAYRRMEPELVSLRVVHFYGAPPQSQAAFLQSKGSWLGQLLRRR